MSDINAEEHYRRACKDLIKEDYDELMKCHKCGASNSGFECVSSLDTDYEKCGSCGFGRYNSIYESRAQMKIKARKPDYLSFLIGFNTSSIKSNKLELRYNKLEQQLKETQEKLKIAVDALESVKHDCDTHVDRPWISDFIRKSLKEISELDNE